MTDSKVTFNGVSAFNYKFGADIAKKISDEKIIGTVFLAVWEILNGEKVNNVNHDVQIEYGDYEVKLTETFGNYLESVEIGIESGNGIHGGNANWKFNLLPASISASAITKLDIRFGGFIHLDVKAEEQKLHSIKKLMQEILP